MKINYSGIIAEEQCMKASSWQADEPVAHINVVKRLITQVNEAEKESAKLREQVKELKENAERIGCNRFERLCKADAENQKLRELAARLISKLEHSHFCDTVLGEGEGECDCYLSKAFAEIESINQLSK